VLLFAQRDADDADAVVAGERQAHAAPATADVEDAHSGLDQELTCDVVLLRFLRLVQSHVGPGEIGAGVLLVGVEEEIVERARQVVVMRHVAAGAAHGVERAQPPQVVAQRFERGDPCRHALRRLVRDRKPKEPVQIVVPEGDPTVGVALAEGQFGVRDKAAQQRLVPDVKDDRRSGAAAEGMGFSVGQVDDKRPLPHHGADHPEKQRPPHGQPPLGAPRRRSWCSCSWRRDIAANDAFRCDILFLNRGFVKVLRRFRFRRLIYVNAGCHLRCNTKFT
jgi:hypothetical protein